MSVFADLIGQDETVGVLHRAVATSQRLLAGDPVAPGQFTHAWLFVGPPGSGRSVAARAFATALQCGQSGCGGCISCRTALGGTHADVRLVVPEGLTLGVDEMRSLVLRASSAPSGGRFHVLVIEDADRLTEAAANALLKALEEPPPRTVFLLCSPSLHPDDMPVTIRSRCRVLTLRAPAPADIAGALVHRDGVDEATATWAAQVAQSHVGRARRLALDPQARDRRATVLGVPRSLRDVGACFAAADVLISAAEQEAAAFCTELDEREGDELAQALGAGGTGKGAGAAARGVATARKELARRQRSRATRVQRDALDRALVDLAAFYRDVLLTKVGAVSGGVGFGVGLVHADFAEVSQAAANKWSAESALRRIDAVLACQQAIAENVKPRIAVEAMMLELRQG